MATLTITIFIFVLLIYCGSSVYLYYSVRNKMSQFNESDKKSSALYYVVEFPDEDKNGNTPLSVVKKTDKLQIKMVRNHISPKKDNSWSSNHIRIKYKSALCEKAVKKKNILENFSSVTQSDESGSDININCKKRGHRNSRKFEDYVDFSRSDETEDVPCIRAPNQKSMMLTTDTNYFKNNKDHNFVTVICEDKYSGKQKAIENDNNSEGLSLYKTNISTQRSDTSWHINESKQIPPFMEIQNTPSSSPRIPSYLNRPVERSGSTVSRLDEIKRPQRSFNDEDVTKGLLKKILAKLITIENDVKVIKQLARTDGSAASSTDVFNNELFEMLPVRTVQELEKLNEKLLEQDAITQLSTQLQLLGGRALLDTTRRILSTVIHQDLAVQCNWSGKNNKSAFNKFKNIIILILGTIIVKRYHTKRCRRYYKKLASNRF